MAVLAVSGNGSPQAATDSLPRHYLEASHALHVTPAGTCLPLLSYILQNI